MGTMTTRTALALIACLLLASPQVGLAIDSAYASSSSKDALLAGKSAGRCGPFDGSTAVEQSKEALSESGAFHVVVCQKHLREHDTKLIHSKIDGVDVEFPVFADPDDLPRRSDDRSSSSKASSDSSLAQSSSSDSASPVQVVIGFIARLVANVARHHRKLLQGEFITVVPTGEEEATVNNWLVEYAFDNADVVNGRSAITATSLKRGDEPGEIFFAVFILTTEPDLVMARAVTLSAYDSPLGSTTISAPQPCGEFGDVVAFGEEEDLSVQMASAPPSDCSNPLDQPTVMPPGTPEPVPTTTAPPPQFENYDASTRNCIDPDGAVYCEEEGTSFLLVDGDGALVRSAAGDNIGSGYFMEGEDNEMVGFFSTRPIYIVDPGYPGSNKGVQLENQDWARIKLGTGLISSANRPAATTTCSVSQVSTYEQGNDDMQSPPKENWFTVSDYAFMNSMTMTIYPSGDVWFDTEFYSSGYTFAFEWACQWPVADAANTQSVTLNWGGPTETNFVDHESSGKSCVEPGGKDNLCDLYGTLFTIVDGDGGSSGMKATLVKMGEERVGFYSSQPVYLVNQGYPGNNDGPDLDEGWFKVSMGDGLIPAGLRPANAVSCIGTQLNDYAQGADRALAPKENLYTASTYEMPPAMFINIYPDGNVWVEAVSYPSDYELVWEWACQWSIDNTNGVSKTLAWAAAPKTGFKDHESGEKSCIDKTGDDACDIEYGVDFVMVDGDGSSTTQAMLVPQGNMRGFYSARPVYAVDVDYPTSNDGIGDDGFTKVMMGGPGFLDQGDRPSKPVTCLVSFLSTENQSASLQAPPKDNLYSAGSYDFKHMAVMNIYPDGSIWLELDFSDDDLNFVLEWACLWAVPDS